MIRLPVRDKRVNGFSASYRRLAGEASARIIPRTALTSRDDQPVLVKIERMVLCVVRDRSGGW